jgi:hypothetical protein
MGIFPLSAAADGFSFPASLEKVQPTVLSPATTSANTTQQDLCKRIENLRRIRNLITALPLEPGHDEFRWTKKKAWPSGTTQENSLN